MNIDLLISDATFSMEDLYLKHVEVLKRGAVFKIHLEKADLILDSNLLNKLVSKNFVLLKESTNPPFDSNFFINQYSVIKYKKLFSGKNIKLKIYISDQLKNPSYDILLADREWDDKEFQLSIGNEELVNISNQINLSRVFYITVTADTFLNFRMDGDVLANSLLASFEKRMLQAINSVVDKKTLSSHSLKEIDKFNKLKQKHNYGFKDAYELYCFLTQMTYKFNGNPYADRINIPSPWENNFNSSHWFTLSNILKSIKKSKQNLEAVEFNDLVLKSYTLVRDRRHNYGLKENKKVK